jgi:hypothetical protein
MVGPRDYRTIRRLLARPASDSQDIRPFRTAIAVTLTLEEGSHGYDLG